MLSFLIIERISSRERIGETENADPAQDTTPLNISAYEKDLTPIDLDLPLLTPNS